LARRDALGQQAPAGPERAEALKRACTLAAAADMRCERAPVAAKK
jgi:hypothetical protein